MLTEKKPWFATDDDGTLNPNSYAATGVFALVAKAVEQLDENGIELTATTVDAMATGLAKIVTDVQQELAGSTAFQDGMNSRLRGALHLTMETMPPPFGGTTDDWNDWTDAATNRVRAIAAAALRLFNNGTPATGNPLTTFATDTGLAAA